MPTEIQTVDWSTPWFLHAAFLLTTAAFLFRDILWLRVLTILANFFLIFGAYHAAPEPLWPNIYYYLGLVAVNTGHAGYLAYERSLVRFNEDEQKVYDSAFKTLDRVSVKKLLKAGEWLILLPGDVIAREGQVPERVFIIADGKVAVKVREQTIACLVPGRFVGEISFLTDGPASADVVAEEASKCVAWERAALRHLLNRNKDLYTVMYAAFGADLSAKLAAHNVTLTES